MEQKHHNKRCQVEALVDTVMKTWYNGDLSDTLGRVFDRLKRVLCNIIEAGGSNDLVETRRGKKEADRSIRTDDDLKTKLTEFQMQSQQQINVIVPDDHHDMIYYNIFDDDDNLDDFVE